DVALQAQLLVLAAQPNELLAVGRRHNLTVLLPAALLSVGLGDPVADRLGGRLELTRELGRISPGVDQINHLPPEFRRVRRACLGHGVLLLRKPEGLHEGGSTSESAREREIWPLVAASKYQASDPKPRPNLGFSAAP